jgi:hypothetical protein
MRNLITIATLIVVTAGCGSEKAYVSPAPLITPAERGGPYIFVRDVGDVHVRGGVFAPGRYAWTNGMTVLDAIQAARGFTDSAVGVKIMHMDGTSKGYNYRDIIDTDNPPMLRNGDRVYVARRLW